MKTAIKPSLPQNSRRSARPTWSLIAGGVAILFGLATIGSGALVLFGSPASRSAAGAVVPFVLWFNFLSGFLYVAAGIGLLLWMRWAARLAALLALGTMGVGIAFATHVAGGGAYELRTAAAMALRAIIWTVIALLACRALTCLPRQPHAE